MNKDNAHLYLPLVQALSEGKVIQRRDIGGTWFDSPDIFDGEPASRYRIKPEPREWFQVRSRGGAIIGDFTNKPDARDYAAETGLDVIHVREVLPT